ncbi:hypothetical protein M413DRAFT_256352 [Hebeloma cylindrosporum]|uniref:Uncharacterized protein n=1 Tax=Hebeloma cylindrosporum TaxID=76867 RepID=A0A0C2XJ12_HEBCY|nr:hypothetical protein M413DRAFT_256352 [Hebeloma cylindrosporum h7]
MLNFASSLSTTLLHLTVIFSCWGRAQSALAENVTIEDADPSILYQPADSWHSSLDACSTCLKLGTTALSYHECSYPLSPDEKGHISSPPKPPTTTAASVPLVTTNPSSITPARISPLSTPTMTGIRESGDDHNGEPTGGRGGPGMRGKRVVRRGVAISRLGLNHTIPADPDITVSFNFTGSALYVFGIQPRGVPTNGAPTNMNLSFTLDNIPSGDFHSLGRPGVTGFNFGVPIFIKRDLKNISHHFIARVGRNSTFLLDYIIYTSVASTTVDRTTTSIDSPTVSPQSSSSSVIDPLVSNFRHLSKSLPP